MDIFTLLRQAKSEGASDLHLVVASPPLFRINGSLQNKRTTRENDSFRAVIYFLPYFNHIY